MTNLIYNQISSKLYNMYESIRWREEKETGVNNKCEYLRTLQFCKELEIETKVVDLFSAIYEQNNFDENNITVDGIFSAIRAFFPISTDLDHMSQTTLVDRARVYAIQSHRNVNQLYDDAPYEIHLYMAAQFDKKYNYLIPEIDRPTVSAAVWNHDVVEDGHRTFNNVKEATSERVARIACAVSTNVYGHNRAQRADENYYARIRAEQYATYVKLCDRLANISNGGKMVDGYRKEMPKFLLSLNQEELKNYRPMVDELLSIVDLKYEKIFKTTVLENNI